MAKRVVLAYSGGLDTSVAVRWLREERGVEVIALAADVGQGGDFESLRQRALDAGATDALVVDCVDEFADDYVAPALKARLNVPVLAYLQGDDIYLDALRPEHRAAYLKLLRPLLSMKEAS